MVGIATKKNFEETPYKVWFDKNYTNYKLDTVTIAKLEKNLKGVTITGFMGTWCSDSRKGTPPFYKILEASNFGMKNLTLITLNKRKRTPQKLDKNLKIIRVPTFVFYKKGKEIGRYVEKPRETLEKDFLKIVTENGYKHSYEK